MDTDSEYAREVFARFGLAIYHAQCVERTLAILMATVYGPGPEKITKSDYDKLLSTSFRRTLGNLIGELNKKGSMPSDLAPKLTIALEKRNWLIHNYFWERAVRFTTLEGSKDMIMELEEIAESFDVLDKELDPVC